MKDKKNWVIAVLLFAVFMMSVGYAVFAANLSIEGTTVIDTTNTKWDVKITGIESTVTGLADPGTAEQTKFTDTKASFRATLKQPKDSVTYTITVTNAGTIPAKLDSLTFAPEASVPGETEGLIRYSVVSSPAIGSVLEKDGTATFVVKTEFDENATSDDLAAEGAQLTKDFTATIGYVQNDTVNTTQSATE